MFGKTAGEARVELIKITAAAPAVCRVGGGDTATVEATAAIVAAGVTVAETDIRDTTTGKILGDIGIGVSGATIISEWTTSDANPLGFKVGWRYMRSSACFSAAAEEYASGDNCHRVIRDLCGFATRLKFDPARLWTFSLELHADVTQNENRRERPPKGLEQPF